MPVGAFTTAQKRIDAALASGHDEALAQLAAAGAILDSATPAGARGPCKFPFARWRAADATLRELMKERVKLSLFSSKGGGTGYRLNWGPAETGTEF